MTTQDPIADMLTRIRNAQNVKYEKVSMPSSKTKVAIASVLLDEGYIRGYRLAGDEVKPVLEVDLKYCNGKGVIEKIKRKSRPGLRIYRGYNELAKSTNSFGISIVSTSKGVMSHKRARSMMLGGEVMCVVW